MAQQHRFLEELCDVGIGPRQQVDFRAPVGSASSRFDHSQLRFGIVTFSGEEVRGPSDDTHCVMQLECQCLQRSPDAVQRKPQGMTETPFTATPLVR
jgi:hypothetical protein